ncbi:MAG: sulfurtransferase TusA family protein [Deltaproteobacteria bacterium]|nr:sulfurtransferase TusA family protein [Deltaproteobacteria bacterium]
MSEKIDARGLSCPQPVIMTNKKMKEIGRGAFEVLVDTETAKENITRLAQQSGWQLDVNEESGNIRLVLKKA